MFESDYRDELEWFCETSSVEMGFDDVFERYQKFPELTGDSDFYSRVKGWRERVMAHPIFADEFDGYGEFAEQRTFAEVLFCIVDRIKELILEDRIPVVGWSGGKDSSVLLLLLNLAYGELYLEGKLKKRTDRGVVVHADTLVDNVEVSYLASQQWNEMMNAYYALAMPVDQILTRPTFNSSFLGRVVTGRKLPTIAQSKFRECSDDWKVKPNNTAVKRYLKRKQNGKARAVMFLGSRDEEGAIRASSIAKNGGSDDPLAVGFLKKHGMHVCYPIKDLKTEHIWEILTLAGKGENKVIPSLVDYDETISLYASSSGECVMLMNDQSGGSQPCGSRHGCWTCTAGSIEDKSMVQMLKSDAKYSYMKQLNRIRDFIIKDHFNWENRSIWNRSINKHGFVAIRPDLYSFKKVQLILKAMLTADALERERAYDVEMKILDGELPRTPENVRFSKRQFQLVSRADIYKIDYIWCFHQQSDRAFSALKLWDDVHEKGDFELLEWVDDMEAIPSTPQPPAHYIYCGKDWSDDGNNIGLVDYLAELVAFEPSLLRVPKVNGKGEHYEVMSYEESDSINVSSNAVWLFDDGRCWEEPYNIGTPPTWGALTLLREGVISLAKGRTYQNHQMAMRYQWHRQRGLVGDVSYLEFSDRLAEFEKKAGCKIFTLKEYRQIASELDLSLAELEIEPEDSTPEQVVMFQGDLFDDSFEKVVSKRKSLTRGVKKAKKDPAGIEGQLSIF
ncbi:hypothetical protein [Vibrio mediterranei]|uniref:hypothetical protein n=1 Tax=Vibrio mediterranei TaxID=689 RepID=UPI0040680929